MSRMLSRIDEKIKEIKQPSSIETEIYSVLGFYYVYICILINALADSIGDDKSKIAIECALALCLIIIIGFFIERKTKKNEKKTDFERFIVNMSSILGFAPILITYFLAGIDITVGELSHENISWIVFFVASLIVWGYTIRSILSTKKESNI